MTLLELADRCEREEPSRALAREIQCRLGGWQRYTSTYQHGRGGSHPKFLPPKDQRDGGDRDDDRDPKRWLVRDVPDLTVSLDAAVAFVERVLPDCNWSVDRDKEAMVEWGKRREERWFFSQLREHAPRPFAKTPALALVSATLRALAARDGAPKEEETPHDA